MSTGRRWAPSEINRVRELAALPGNYASVIGAQVGATLQSVLTICGKHGIAVTRYTPDEQAYADQLRKARQKRKDDKWKAKQKQQPQLVRRVQVHLGTSRTHPIYRNQLPRLADSTSKEALRRMITEAVKNTAEMVI